MASSIDNDNIPQWKKDLIARLRSQNRTKNTIPSAQPAAAVGHQPKPTPAPSHSGTESETSSPVASAVSSQTFVDNSEQCNNVPSARPSVKSNKMVQERMWFDHKQDFIEMVNENGCQKDGHDSDSDSSEDLHYGPGIVNKLKNKYLSLAFRESNVKSRPSILKLRKATSLENMLDDDGPGENTCGNRLFQPRLNGNDTGSGTLTSRYRPLSRRVEMKRARSVETISRTPTLIVEEELLPSKRQSFHEEVLIAGEDVSVHRKVHDNENGHENKFSNRVNRPKRIQPIMNEREKPPADVVKQAKMIFEKRPEQRTKKPPQTGDVAAKVDSFNNIIVKAKVAAKKPPIKHNKPVLNDKNKSNTHHVRPVAKPVIISEEISKPKSLEINKVPKKQKEIAITPPSPIPDVSRVDHKNDNDRCNDQAVSGLSETPDLILTSSPLPSITSPTFKKTSSERFIKEEIYNSIPVIDDDRYCSPVTSPSKSIHSLSHSDDSNDSATFRVISPTSQSNISKNAANSAVFDFTKTKTTQEHFPVNRDATDTKTPLSEPLKIEVNGHNNSIENRILSPKILQVNDKPKIVSPPLRPVKTNLTVTEIEKNHKNTVKSLQQPSVNVNYNVEVVNKVVVPKKPRTRQQDLTTTAVFNFTNRKDVPDYISNDKSRSPMRPELPKPGEGGIILIPGAVDEWAEEEQILRSLEGPPSPCDVTFINDNILINGKSSLNQRAKRIQLKISFVDEGPDIFEYPSENSLLLEEASLSPVSNSAQSGRTVPTFTGSSLANYTPKTAGEFHPGVTKSVQQPLNKPDVTDVEPSSDLVLEEVEMPIVFSAGSNTDILF